MWQVQFEISICDNDAKDKEEHRKGIKYWVTEAKTVFVDMPFIPFKGMHVGDSQFLTVCQVYWLGENRFRATCRTKDCCEFIYPDFHRRYTTDEAINRLIETKFGWTFERHDEEE